MPGEELKDLRNRVINQYPFPDHGTEQENLTVVAAVIQDSTFTCNTRQLFDAYSGKTNVYMMNYHFLAKYNLSFHASDLLPTFYNTNLDVAGILEKCQNVSSVLAQTIAAFLKSYAPAYQSYLKSHAISGDPNTNTIPRANQVRWPLATTSSSDNHDKVRQIMEPYYPNPPFLRPPFRISPEDLINTATICGFWNSIAADIIKIVDSEEHEEHETSLALMIQGSERPAPHLVST